MKTRCLFVSNSGPNRKNFILNAFQNRKDILLEILHEKLHTSTSTKIEKVFEKLRIPLDVDDINQRILKKCREFKPNIIFVVKGNKIHPQTLKIIKKNYKCKLVSWSLDNMYLKHNRSIYYSMNIKYYDYVFTTKKNNLNELSKMGAQRVKFLWQAYCATTHRPLDLPSSVAPSDVTFIGSAEEQRYEVLRYLANNGIALSVFGSGWDKKRYQRHSHLLEINKFDLIGLEYAEKIYNSKINLCFLRKMNNDLHTSRSIEIPACGGFMLAEKTNEHEDLFTDKLEAVYFNNKEDLLDKIIYYLENRKVRERIAGNGFLRTRQSDYSYDAMVNNILKELNDE